MTLSGGLTVRSGDASAPTRTAGKVALVTYLWWLGEPERAARRFLSRFLSCLGTGTRCTGERRA